jgi:hypothetical protein
MMAKMLKHVETFNVLYIYIWVVCRESKIIDPFTCYIREYGASRISALT